ncbi:MAG: hypothetical protein H0T76_05990 [Nannocystis sp.]|nr:hypothetical protein [Nannocystis sp.]MBA3546011.1 hypothetical protein [Nannocystis sp.]
MTAIFRDTLTFEQPVTLNGVVGLKAAVPITATSLVGTTVYRVLSPYAGTVSMIKSVIQGALTTGNATLTAKINGVAITTGILTLTQAGSAPGDIDTCSPTAANTVAVGDELSWTVGGTNDAAVGAAGYFEITRSV